MRALQSSLLATAGGKGALKCIQPRLQACIGTERRACASECIPFPFKKSEAWLCDGSVRGAAAPAAPCDVEAHTDYRGHDMQPLVKRAAANSTACCALCRATPGCRAWTLQQARSALTV